MTTTETEIILEKIKQLDYIEGKNLSIIAKKNNFKKQLFINIAYKIRDANLNGAKKNQFSDFLFMKFVFGGLVRTNLLNLRGLQ